ncbi:MAG TPA: wax ester/triacylglycerol synthase family O-acyltransferase [Burkholderiaceae bacterium]|nr:wax ester/triacylglycerol synthase family O-acyltransferase [Burkholderiaceae bacterium]HMY99311.1 wax ester/triacylglycerol synthase family O-acyltransferase [Burkholderiaceae bacterium]HNG79922.1 wax ester/triacylglycerol synthase family O-acyltransferase [Burkholderiaceae bacterium]
MPARERMSPVDTAWLRMDRPSNLMMIVGVMYLPGPVDASRLRATVQRRLVQRFRRFRQKAVSDWTGWWWQDDPEFDLDRHLVHSALPAPAGQAELQRYVSDLATEPLHPDRPLWRYDIIDHCNGGSAIVTRIHHCIADGIALVGVMLSMCDLDPDAPAELPLEAGGPKASRRPAHDLHQDPWAALLDPITQATSAALGMGGRFWQEYLRVLEQPDRLVGYGKHGMGFATELGKLLAMPADSPTRYKGKTGSHKRVAWCDPIPLDEVKAVSKALGCSVNDLLLNAVAGALRSYLDAQGDTLEGVEMRAMVPVNLRRGEPSDDLGNRFGLVTLLLPLYEGNPFKRLALLRERMLEMRGSYQPPLTMLLLGVSGVVPKFLQEQFLDILANKASAVMTNVPGPQQPLYLAGQRIEQIMFWVPQSGDIGIGVSILSYNQNVQFGLIADRRFIPDPEAVIPLFRAEFEKIVTGALLHDWVEPFNAQDFEEQIEVELGKRPRKAPKAEVSIPPEPTVSAKKARKKAASQATGKPAAKKVAQATAKKTPVARKSPAKPKAGVAPIPEPTAPAADTQVRIPKRFRGL